MKKVIICLGFLVFTFFGFAQTPNEVTLVVTGEGATKEEATNNALRSAVEQTFGVFVSANTEILNDELVKDEIATVSSGNIKEYSVISALNLSPGIESITLSVTVSVGQLISYAKSKGSECEFAGATFGANYRLYKLYRKNTELALENLYKEMISLLPSIYDYELEIDGPVLSADSTARLKLTVVYKANKNTRIYDDLIKNTLKGLTIDPETYAILNNQGFKLYQYIHLDCPYDFDAKKEGSKYDGYNYVPSPLTYLYFPLKADRFFNINFAALTCFNIYDSLNGYYSLSVGDRNPEMVKEHFVSPHADGFFHPFISGYFPDALYKKNKSHSDSDSTCILRTNYNFQAGDIIMRSNPMILYLPVHIVESITSFRIEPATIKESIGIRCATPEYVNLRLDRLTRD